MKRLHCCTMYVVASVLTVLCLITPAPAQSIFVNDIANNDIHEYTNSGSLIRTFDTGNGFNSFRGYGLTFGPDGLLYAANNNGHTIEKFDPNTGAYLGSVGSFPDFPLGLAFGPDGNLYVTGSNRNVFRVDPVNNSTSLLFTPGIGSYGLAFRPDNGDLLLPAGSRIQEYNLSTNSLVGTFADGYSGNLGDIKFGPDGRLYGVDIGTNIKVVGANGATAVPFSNGGIFGDSIFLAFDNAGNLFINEFDSVERFNGVTGDFLNAFNSPDAYGIAINRIIPTAAVPEPGAVVLSLAVCLFGGTLLLRRRSRP